MTIQQAFQIALELKPDFPMAHNNLGVALRDRGQYDDAVAAFRRALQLKPNFPEALNNLGNALKEQGELDDAIAAYRMALQFEPAHAWAHSNLVYALHLHPRQDATTISEEHQRWNRQFSDPLKPFLQPHANDPAVARRLRVGYVSPDFLDHAVGRYLLPLCERHDREEFEILCYSGVARPDSMTDRFRALASGWRDTDGVADARLAEMIREEGVLALWARVLEAAKGSRLLMLCPEGSARERVRAFFGARGIGVERVEFVSYLPRSDYFQLYQRIDVALDPFPFNGMTTTCDALWMGAPVLTLPGEMPASRASLSILSTVGLGEFSASSEEDYVRIAVELAGDLPRLAELRATLRPRMKASPLMNAPRFARNVEAAYREMWRRWSEDASPLSD